MQALQMEGVIATAAHCDVTSKAEVEALIGHTVQQVRCHCNPHSGPTSLWKCVHQQGKPVDP